MGTSRRPLASQEIAPDAVQQETQPFTIAHAAAGKPITVSSTSAAIDVIMDVMGVREINVAQAELDPVEDKDPFPKRITAQPGRSAV